jgi:hypothetical protein
MLIRWDYVLLIGGNVAFHSVTTIIMFADINTAVRRSFS